MVRAAVVCLAVLSGAALDAQVSTPKYSRLQRLERWTDALEQHAPGQRDRALDVFADWNARDFAEFKTTVFSALALVRDPDIRSFFRPPGRGPVPSIPSQVFYSRDELRQLIDVAKRLKRLGELHMLHRAAMMHMDAVVLGSGSDSRGGERNSDFFVFRFDDGQGLGRQEALGQWDLARFLLEQVRPDPKDFQPHPGRDEWVRRWYRTLIAYQLAQMHFNVADAERGLELFRNDSELLFLTGVLHETMASPGVQEPFRKSDDIRRLVRIRTAGAELDTAEDMLRRALKESARPFPEARLHLGRVLAEQGRHKDAVPEFAQALSLMQNQELQYFGWLFSGRSAQVLGQATAAREAFERAARLKPSAQSPLLALSQLAYNRGDTGEAAALLARVAELPGLEYDDPWWTYRRTVGRFFGPSHQEIVDDLRKEMPR